MRRHTRILQITREVGALHNASHSREDQGKDGLEVVSLGKTRNE